MENRIIKEEKGKNEPIKGRGAEGRNRRDKDAEGRGTECRITESEWQLMELVWQGCDTQPQMMERLGGRWNKNTVHTFLVRLCEKGFLEVDKESTPHVYRALVCREDCERQERHSFLRRVYQGSVGNMVAAFVKDGELSEAELEKLRKLLDESMGG